MTGLFSIIFGDPTWLRCEVIGCIVVEYEDSDYFKILEEIRWQIWLAKSLWSSAAWVALRFFMASAFGPTKVRNPSISGPDRKSILPPLQMWTATITTTQWCGRFTLLHTGSQAYWLSLIIAWFMPPCCWYLLVFRVCFSWFGNICASKNGTKNDNCLTKSTNFASILSTHWWERVRLTISARELPVGARQWEIQTEIPPGVAFLNR